MGRLSGERQGQQRGMTEDRDGGWTDWERAADGEEPFPPQRFSARHLSNLRRDTECPAPPISLQPAAPFLGSGSGTPFPSRPQGAGPGEWGQFGPGACWEIESALPRAASPGLGAWAGAGDRARRLQARGTPGLWRLCGPAALGGSWTPGGWRRLPLPQVGGKPRERTAPAPSSPPEPGPGPGRACGGRRRDTHPEPEPPPPQQPPPQPRPGSAPPPQPAGCRLRPPPPAPRSSPQAGDRTQASERTLAFP
ncbi:basic proline-rich protein-like [Dromiciops gliroides]|uniref:basic proline-rich protein-like n=1 Tax=Dromiciops gliroides TaxID=33562 RepID=UPI001CC62790|nr:basic proline-rich protein-like [Dromiciops gliroides]